MFWQIFPASLLVTIASIAGVAWYADREFRRFHLDQTLEILTARASLFEGYLRAGPGLDRPEQLDALCKELGARADVRITVIQPDGVVVGDTERDPGTMDNHGDRPEVRAALRGVRGWEIRRSDTLEEDMMYVAIASRREGRVVAVVRAAVPLGTLESTLRAMYLRVGVGGVVAVGVAGVLCWIAARRITGPLEALRRGVASFGRGRFERPLRVPNSEEIGALADAMNEMAASLEKRMKTIAEQRQELEAVFDAMSEGVLAVDLEERVTHLNRSAERLLGTTASVARGRFIQEVARNPDLQAFVRRTLASDAPIEGDITWQGSEDRYFKARGGPLRDSAAIKTGSLVVLSEVTRLYRLQRVRRDFVANASHEMQTPITSIYGYAETLLDRESRTDDLIEKAAQAIVRQAGRLSALVDDLLELSRIEKQADAKEVPLGLTPVREVLEAAVETCRAVAADRGVSIEIACPPDIKASLNPELLERAIVNLIDNATKYSEGGREVRVEAEMTADGVVIRVRDQGCGISREHLPRLFERFYRVDKARSRALGGTGLGLAIVKHIVLAHGGRVTAESTVGQGSVFSISLPRAEPV